MFLTFFLPKSRFWHLLAYLYGHFFPLKPFYNSQMYSPLLLNVDAILNYYQFKPCNSAEVYIVVDINSYLYPGLEFIVNSYSPFTCIYSGMYVYSFYCIYSNIQTWKRKDASSPRWRSKPYHLYSNITDDIFYSPQ